jgi:hypothetical protein
LPSRLVYRTYPPSHALALRSFGTPFRPASLANSPTPTRFVSPLLSALSHRTSKPYINVVEEPFCKTLSILIVNNKRPAPSCLHRVFLIASDSAT